MKIFKQTWWDKEIKTQFKEFKSWVGPSSAKSKVFMRNYIKKNKYRTFVDIGCGNATEYFAYQKEYPELIYLGVDSSSFLVDLNVSKGVPMLEASAEDTGIDDNQFEVAFSRHVLEHQPDYKPILNEMIKIASKMVIHVFFIPPRDAEIINWQKETNLYHNTFIRKEMENFIMSNPKVKNFIWLSVTDTEEALIIKLK